MVLEQKVDSMASSANGEMADMKKAELSLER